MQNLRDKLLNAGVVDKKAKKKADHRARLARTKRKREQIGDEQLQAAREQSQRERDEARRQADRQREDQRKREAERQAEALARREEAAQRARRKEEQRLIAVYRVRELIQASMFLPPRPGPIRFHFVDRLGAIRSLDLTVELARELENGQRAIAQLPGRERWGLVQRDVAEQALAVEPALIRFQAWSGEGGAGDVAPPPAAVADPAAKPKQARAPVGAAPARASDDRRDR